MVQQKPASDRRDSDRPPHPQCQKCGATTGVTCALRTTMVMYFRCERCIHVWSMKKPRIMI